MLIAAAAKSGIFPKESLKTENGWVIDERGGRRASYGELAERAALERPLLNFRLRIPKTTVCWHKYSPSGRSR